MASQTNPEALCKFCRQKPVFVEDGYEHDFCGKWCAAASRSGSRPPRRTSTPTTRPAPNGGVCRLAGCSKPVHINADGTLSEWCSHRHRVKAVETGKAEVCLFCRRLPKAMVNGKRSDFCSPRCGRDTISLAPIMLAVDKSHTAYENVSSQFKSQWLHDTPVPNIVKIWKLYGTADLTDRFMRYKLNMERRIGQLGGNSRRRWHGTIRECRLGDDDTQMEFCEEKKCSLCSIIRTSFDKAQFGSRTNFGRFGAGIYTSATSSKANDYVGTSSSPYEAVLLCEVIMGQPIKLTDEHRELVNPPPGFDSVVGEPGDVLNYDESIVYRNDAIRPLFLVIYDDGLVPALYPRAER